MATTSKSSRVSQKSAHRFTWKKAGLLAACTVAGVALIAQILLDVHFWRSANYSSDNAIVGMIIQTVKGVNKPAVIEPISKRAYLPDANLALGPFPQDMSTIEYSYTPSFDGTDAEANVTVTNAVNYGISKLLNAQSMGAQYHNPETIFDAVPGLQVCVRGVHVVFGTKMKYDHLQFASTLADGRTMNVYTEKQPCAYNLQPLIDYLRTAESY